MDYMENYNAWLNGATFDQATKTELKAIALDKKEIEDRFYKNLDFGTGGLRGLLGAGTNRMNIYTVSKATQGLANYILKQGADVAAKGVAIAHDPRRMSPEFSKQAALVLNGNGIKTTIFDALRPTPVLSFAVRHLGCTAGIVITASHNPKEYNGFKAYWSDGGQIPYPQDEAIITEVNLVEDFAQIKVAVEQQARAAGLFNVADASLDDAYIKNVKAQSINPAILKEQGDKMAVVFTPLNGAGNVPVRRVLKEIGFNQVHVVKEQELPDPEFSTLTYPNPEDPKAFTLALKLAQTVNADLILATDPDADRLGCIAKNSDGAYVVLTGNMIGILIAEYIMSQTQKNNTMPPNPTLISTIVSTNMTKMIANAYGATYVEVLTGFKYIGEKIKAFEATGSNTFMFGFEESYGFLAGTYARDKDAVVAAMLLCELAATYKARGLTLCDGLNEMYEKYGYYKESVESITLKGLDGIKNIGKIMSSLRTNPPQMINHTKVIGIRDYQNQTHLNTQTGATEPILLPVSDVCYFELEDASWFCVRPSGTEPKIKIYFGVKGSTDQDADDQLTKIASDVMQLVQ